MERLMPSLGIGGKLRLEVIWFFKTLSGGGFLPLIAGLQTSSLLSPFFHPLRPLFPQPVFSLLVCLSVHQSVCLGLPQHGEAEEEAAKGRTAQQLHGRGLALAQGQLLLQTGPEHLPGWTGLRARTSIGAPPSLAPHSEKPCESWV